MKCDELKYEQLGDMMPFYPRSTLVIRKQFVDDAIDELKRENEKLKKKMDDYHLMSDIRRAKIKELKRALWSARAYRAHAELHWTAYLEYVHIHGKSFYEFDGDYLVHRSNKNNDSFREWCKRWASVERKCRIKAKEFK